MQVRDWGSASVADRLYLGCNGAVLIGRSELHRSLFRRLRTPSPEDVHLTIVRVGQVGLLAVRRSSTRTHYDDCVVTARHITPCRSTESIFRSDRLVPFACPGTATRYPCRARFPIGHLKSFPVCVPEAPGHQVQFEVRIQFRRIFMQIRLLLCSLCVGAEMATRTRRTAG